ncbi:STAS domain-containing protein [Nocardia arizonensis]|uniref:STAS domain-containing protein n=1 Tax=Nocardia arizonensis TaxID=1141647 RepID=UPI0006CFAC3E|nr:STAS domain-containing protein [Nocardia arizonensis]
MSTVSTTTRLPRTERRFGPHDRLQVSVTAPGSRVTLCAVAGEVDLYTADVLRRALSVAVHAGAPTVVLDLSGVLFFGVAGLHVLIEARERVGRTGRRLWLVAGPLCVDRVLEVADDAAVFERVPDLAAAVLDTA